MVNKFLGLVLLIVMGLAGCTKDGDGPSTLSESYYTDDVSQPGRPGDADQAGVITAGEWNDLDNWQFLENILKKADFKGISAKWDYFNLNRISVLVKGTDSLPVVDALVKLKSGAATVFTARTDNQGRAELWPDLYGTAETGVANLSIDVNNGAAVIANVKSYQSGSNKIIVPPGIKSNKIEVAFVVDATGSMGDELRFLNTELLDVISRVKKDNPSSELTTASVFYRDKGDEYVTRVSGFTSNINTTLNFIKDQQAAGGGDIPEAVHSALDKTINELQWSPGSKTRLAFLILDAPPHQTAEVLNNLKSSILKAAEKGIKIIPVTASGTDKETEFLMRFIAITTNGTYVFITDHSGIGNDHLEATVGEYQVEFLNNLMVRLINKYAQ
ncbi:VWA domain-containing protein [Paradesertivirga mongoliensis]|uniref:VWA domain-containing protein n=1 Tax=Paradesertivirga mongoliensis TaxID=2100740 RepID=A0ABW4ZJ30_9SPHI|nr:vWA domain-containing protein [Pedobacter mongoliensis]